MDSDEFTIVAEATDTLPRRQWTRSRLEAAKSVADQAIRLGYKQAQVWNDYKGIRGDILYQASG